MDFDPQDMKIIFRDRRIKVQHWDYDHPQGNGDGSIGMENLEMTMNTITQSIQSLMQSLESNPLYLGYCVTHVIIPTIPEWLFREPAHKFTVVLLTRGHQDRSFSIPV